MKQTLIAVAATLLIAIPASAQTKPASKPAAKPAAKPQTKPQTKPTGTIVLGTTQLPGEFGQLQTTYTIGVREPINVTLRRAVYTIEPFVASNNTWVPKGDEKILRLHLTVHNPNPREVFLNWSALKFTAVDATDTNRVGIQAVIRDGTQESLSVSLKPAQKIDVVVAILVPAAGVVPKLIVERETGAPVIRYDLRGKTVALTAPFADESDPTGATVKKSIPAAPGTFYPLGVFDTRLDSIGSVDGTLLGREPGAGKRWITATFTIKNRTASPQRYVWSDFVPELRDADGEKPTWTQAILKATRDEVTSGELAPGEEARIRFFFALPKGVAGKTLNLAEARVVQYNVARKFAFDLTAAKESL